MVTVASLLDVGNGEQVVSELRRDGLAFGVLGRRKDRCAVQDDADKEPFHGTILHWETSLFHGMELLTPPNDDA